MKRPFAVLAAVALAGAAVVWLVANRPSPQRAGVRNVLLITLDTTRADRIGCYGYDAGWTAALDALAERGVRFTQAMASVPLTLPSHATILTGLQPPEHGLRLNGAGRLDDDIPVMAELLGERGYETSAFIAAFALDSSFGLDRGFDLYDDDMTGAYAPEVGDVFAEYRAGDRVTTAALEWLADRGDKPFFCWVHLYDPHAPYYKHEALEGTRFGDQKSYDAEVAFMDMQIGRAVKGGSGVSDSLQAPVAHSAGLPTTQTAEVELAIGSEPASHHSREELKG